MNTINKILVLIMLILPLFGCTQSPTVEHTGLYNLSLVSNNTGIVPIMQSVNTELMFGWFGNMFLLTLGAILFMAFFHSTGEPNKSLAATAYILFVSASFMRVLELVGTDVVLLTFIISAVSTAFLFAK